LTVYTPLGNELWFLRMWIKTIPKGVCEIGLRGSRKNGKRASKPLQEIELYLRGKTKKPRIRFCIQRGTPFQKSVWLAIQKIPYGQTRSYQWIAKKIGRPRAVRAVGSACGKNPLPLIIPCHRVIASHGKIGGFSAGRKWKRRLLQLEADHQNKVK